MKKYNISKKELLHLYVQKKNSIASIARMFNCNDSTIHRKLKKYNIDRRTPWQHKNIKVNTNQIRKLYFNKQKEIKRFIKLINPCIKQEVRRK